MTATLKDALPNNEIDDSSPDLEEVENILGVKFPIRTRKHVWNLNSKLLERSAPADGSSKDMNRLQMNNLLLLVSRKYSSQSQYKFT